MGAQLATPPQVKQLVEKCETIYDLFVHSMCFFMTQTDQGDQVVKSAIEQAIQQIKQYRLEYLAN